MRRINLYTAGDFESMRRLKKINVWSDESLIIKPNQGIANGVVKTKLIRLTTCRAIIKDYIYISRLVLLLMFLNT